MKKLIIAFLFILASLVNAQEQEPPRYFTPFDGTIVLTLDGGATVTFSDYITPQPQIMGRGAVEYYLPSQSLSSFGFKAFGGYGFLTANDKKKSPNTYQTDVMMGGLGFIYVFGLSESVFPSITAGGAYTLFEPKDTKGNKLPNNVAKAYTKNDFLLMFELGLKVKLSQSFLISGNVSAFAGETDALDDLEDGPSPDGFLYGSIGLSYAFMTRSDADYDGIPDDKDRCGNTPYGVKVDEFGCPLDSDRDGVYDYLDKCPDTQTGIPVDEYGCVKDTDNDGVADYIDMCANTPEGIQVDKYGCPIDTDKDGVADYLDKCAQTPIGATVDINGCPMDSDRDGVIDFYDNCPGTEPGVKVDSLGCPIPEPVKYEGPVEFTLAGGATFESGKSELSPKAFSELDKILDAMLKMPQSRWLIEGHTDSKGNKKKNIELSRKRAEAVKEYFTLRGVEPWRIETSGLGPDRPVASNKTNDGRAKNRRVVITIIR